MTALPHYLITLLLLGAAALSARPAHAANTPTPDAPIALWPSPVAPGDSGGMGPEHDTSKPGDGRTAGKAVIRLTDVSVPTITVYRPAKGRETGTAVVVCPGGGYGILAMDLEGTEVCEWLKGIGVTAVLLKYRVPRRPGREPYAAPLQDAQRALGIVRSRAKEWGIRPDHIGVLGFSAGGSLSATLSTNYATRTYPTVDGADAVSCRPDFTILIYPAYLNKAPGDLTLVASLPVDAQTPPTFLAQAENDHAFIESSLAYFAALQRALVPAEMHLYPAGGHGFGLRPTADAPIAALWPRLAEAWMQQSGFLPKEK